MLVNDLMKVMQGWVTVVVLWVCLVRTTQAARLLFLAPISVKSQKNYFTSLTDALADSGHQVGNEKLTSCEVLTRRLTCPASVNYWLLF